MPEPTTTGGQWRAAPLTVANGPGGRRYIAVDDLVTMIRDMAGRLGDGPTKDSLTLLGDTFATMTDLSSTPANDDGSRPKAYRCGDCRQPVIDALTGTDGGTVKVDADHARHGGWLVMFVREGQVTVAPYEHGRHDGALDKVIRLRAHACPPGTVRRA
jgi:hypothetical protein